MVVLWANEEAVFSSSEDRIRASHASVPAAGPSIVSLKTSFVPVAKRTWFHRIAENLFSVLFPSDCRVCGEPLLSVSRLPVCAACVAGIHPANGKLCSVCGERVLSTFAECDDDGLLRCPACRRIDRPFARAIAYGSYDSGLRELIHMLKYQGVRPAAAVLGRMLADSFKMLDSEILQAEAPILLIPVPLYKRKLRQRGFNQSELIARAAVQAYPAPEFLKLSGSLLYRTRDTHSQVGLTSHQRRENLRGAFAVTRAAEVIGRDVLLVDDVYTTGTTATECSKVLRRAGARNVWVATVARTMKDTLGAGFTISAFPGSHENEAEGEAVGVLQSGELETLKS